ncbi:MAG TPA: hypothetical protein VIV57_10160 [Anaeromyxobacter sp.]
MTIKVLDPRLLAEGEPARMAPALPTLAGAVVGLLDNGKTGTAVLYHHLEEILRARFGVREIIHRRKPDMSRPAPPEVLGELSAADAIVSGVGD